MLTTHFNVLSNTIVYDTDLELVELCGIGTYFEEADYGVETKNISTTYRHDYDIKKMYSSGCFEYTRKVLAHTNKVIESLEQELKNPKEKELINESEYAKLFSHFFDTIKFLELKLKLKLF